MWWWKPAIVSVAVLVFMGLFIFGNQGLQEMERWLTLRTDLKIDIQKFTEQKRELEEKEKQLESKESLEHLIREELGYIRDGETVVKFK